MKGILLAFAGLFSWYHCSAEKTKRTIGTGVNYVNAGIGVGYLWFSMAPAPMSITSSKYSGDFDENIYKASRER